MQIACSEKVWSDFIYIDISTYFVLLVKIDTFHDQSEYIVPSHIATYFTPEPKIARNQRAGRTSVKNVNVTKNDVGKVRSKNPCSVKWKQNSKQEREKV